MSLPAYAMSQVSFPRMYEETLVGPLFRPWAETLLDLARVAAGDRVLDVACGTGIVARLARQRIGNEGRVVGVDASAPMLAVAAEIAPEVEWREGDAASLPLGDDDRFDVVVCQQGLQFFADKAAAVREMRRVLASGGRLVIATWRPVEENPLFRDLHRIGERRLGPIVDHRHSMGDGGEIAALLRDAGFEDVRVETKAGTTRFADGRVFVRMNAMALVGMSGAAASMDENERAEALETIVGESAGILPAYDDGGELAFEMRSNVATARG